MKIIKHFAQLFLLINFLTQVLSAAEYYVDKNHASASDNNPGTELLPLLTIQSGVNKAQAGDIVIIKGGADSSDAATYKVSGNGITTKNNGEINNGIIIKSYSDDIVIIEGDGTGDGIELNDSYYEFNGIVFTNFNKAAEGSAIKKGILIENCEFTNTKEAGLRLRNIDGLEIRDTYVHHCFESGISMRGCNNVLIERVESSYNSDGNGAGGDGDGFHSIDGENFTFIDCIAIWNSEDGFDLTSSGKLINCISANHSACNVKIWRRDDDNFAPKSVDIINMINYGAEQAGIKLTNGPELHLFNSVVYGNGEEGVAFRGVSISEGPDTVASYIVNSIISDNGYGGIEVRQSGPNKNKVFGDYNLYYSNGRENVSLFLDDNFLTDDPKFVEPANADFHLLSVSPAIDKGFNQQVYNSKYASHQVDLSFDFDGEDRPKNSAWDIGAFETDATTGTEQSNGELPSTYLLQNYPNPFNPSTKIQFSLPQSSNVKLEVFNMTGEKIVTLANNYFNAGKYIEIWNGKNDYGQYVASGIYLIVLQAGRFRKIRKTVLLK